MVRKSLRFIVSSVAIVGLVVGIWAWDEIVYNVQLLNAYRLGQQYYETHPAIAKNVAYGNQPHQLLDIYQPDAPGNYPVIVYIHGGGWNSGNKELYALVAQKLVPYDVVVVVPRYQLYPDATYPQMRDDVASALAWTVNNIAEYNGDPNRIVFGGQSAGAQLSAMTVFDRSVLASYQLNSSAICAYYGISGVYDINAQYQFELDNGRSAPIMTAVMGGESAFSTTSPVTYVHADIPRTLLIHGDQDETVPLQMSQEFARALTDVGATVSLRVYPGRGHSELLFYTLTQTPGQLITDVIALAQQC
ncbi:MAG: alpha/beta hydrolase [Roseiflexaceae bacterium]|jgi:acetyl esterase/lipase